jgi:Endoribonuclease L-PSP
MSRQVIRTNNAPPSPATYSQAVKAAGLIFVSGTGPFELGTGAVKGETIQEQTHQCLSNKVKAAYQMPSPCHHCNAPRLIKGTSDNVPQHEQSIAQ